MDSLKLITCIVQRNKAKAVIQAALEAGAEGVTSTYSHGTGVRQKLGIIGKLIQAEKETITVLASSDSAEAIYSTMLETGELNLKGNGIVFMQDVVKGTAGADR